MMDLKDQIPLPDLFASRRLLCIQPHPDDMEFSSGGTLAMLADRGTEIVYLTVTDDAAGFSSKNTEEIEERRRIRKEEQYKAGELLGVKDYLWLDLPDAGDWNIRQARNLILGQLRRIRPDFLLTVDPWLPYEAHRDHIKTGIAACEAAILYGLPSVAPEQSVPFESFTLQGVALAWSDKPNLCLDVGAWKDRKRTAIRLHESQLDTSSWEQYCSYDDGRGAREGRASGAVYAESFKILDPRLLHCVPEAGQY
ncbi:MAG: PIG-L family deacetylase [Spirochaetaceae bacterium]|nr:PIG-L family deacetylase [Spirochaetaceae bacterium]